MNAQIEDFMTTQVLSRRLDERTVKAYRLDLEHLYQWSQKQGIESMDEKTVESYLGYLVKEKKLKYSTVNRKYRVFGYYLKHLAVKGSSREGYGPICLFDSKQEDKKCDNKLSRAEIDAFFMALKKEYHDLDNEFRKRVCLRDSVMMELLFYHGIEISQLLRLEVSDYNAKTGNLIIRGKHGKKRSEYLFSGELRKKMEQWIDIHEYFEKEPTYHNVLFLSKIGKPLSMKMVILVFDKYRVMAGIEKACKPKDLKNSLGRYAKEMIREMG